MCPSLHVEQKKEEQENDNARKKPFKKSCMRITDVSISDILKYSTGDSNKEDIKMYSYSLLIVRLLKTW